MFCETYFFEGKKLQEQYSMKFNFFIPSYFKQIHETIYYDLYTSYFLFFHTDQSYLCLVFEGCDYSLVEGLLIHVVISPHHLR